MKAKLTLVVTIFPQLSESFIVSKFLGLLERGYDVHVVCAVSQKTEWQRFSQLRSRPDLRRRVHVRWTQKSRLLAAMLLPGALLRCAWGNPAGTWRYLSRGWRRFGLGVWRRFYKDAEIIRRAPDVLHWEFGALAASEMHLRELLDCKTVVSFRGYDLNQVGIEESDYYHEVWAHADALHLLSRDLWRRALARGCPPEKSHALISPAIDTAFFSRKEEGEKSLPESIGAGPRPLHLLSVGRLDWKKGYEYALEAVRLITDAGVNVEYTIVGAGELRQALAFHRQDLGLERFVRFCGALPREAVRAQMERADILLHAAVSEGFCNAVIEAQSMKLPVVCTDAGGLSENVVDGVTGFVVPRRDAKALAEKVLWLVRDAGLRMRMGDSGRDRVLTHFCIDNQIAEFDRFYRDVLAAELRGRATAGTQAAAVSSAR